jgi:hypothetical protein
VEDVRREKHPGYSPISDGASLAHKYLTKVEDVNNYRNDISIEKLKRKT